MSERIVTDANGMKYITAEPLLHKQRSMIDLERMAREAGLMQYNRRDWCSEQTDGISAEDLARFADLIRADERERCAKVCDGFAESSQYKTQRNLAMWCASDIRKPG